MNLLLDTHVWLWMIMTPDRLSQAARRLISATDTQRVLSAASTWEIAIKYRSRKLTLPGEPAVLAPEWMERTRITPLIVSHRHTLHAGSLPPHHGDPFDRLLIAQAQLEDLPILTADRSFELYDVKVKRAV